MRIISYNILDGGEGRADPLAEVIEAQRADIVALIEADNSEVLERISRRLHMDFIQARGVKHAVALLSRWPIIETINHATRTGSPSCLLEATVRESPQTDWLIGVTHLHPHAGETDESKRELEASALLDTFEPARRARRPHILCGDFNANAPLQQINPERCKPRTREEWRQNGGHLPRRVISRILAAGYLDSLATLHPEQAANTGTFTTQFPGQRIDYIFTFGLPAPQLSQAWIERDRLARYASDHFPVGLEVC